MPLRGRCYIWGVIRYRSMTLANAFAKFDMDAHYQDFSRRSACGIRWYLTAASDEMWRIHTLDRNISTQYYERHWQQPKLSDVEKNLFRKAGDSRTDRFAK